MLLGRIGRHDQALHIYAHKLHDPKKAEEYCKIHYDPEDKDTRDVFISLLEIYLKPPEDERVNVRAAQGACKTKNYIDFFLKTFAPDRVKGVGKQQHPVSVLRMR